MALEKQRFVNYTVGEKDNLKEGKVITVRFNAEEYQQLMIMAKALNISRDSTVLKKLAFIGSNVLFNTFGLNLLKWLTEESRLTDDVKLDGIIVESKENVIQKG